MALLLTVKIALDPIEVAAFTCNRSPLPKHIASSIVTASAPGIVVIVVVVVVVVAVVVVFFFFIVIVVIVEAGGVVVNVASSIVEEALSLSVVEVIVFVVFSVDSKVVVEAVASSAPAESVLSLSVTAKAAGCAIGIKSRLNTITKTHFVFIFYPKKRPADKRALGTWIITLFHGSPTGLLQRARSRGFAP